MSVNSTIVYENSATVPAGQVIRTDPAADEIALPGDTVTIYVSLGASDTGVPDLIGESVVSALVLIEQALLVVGEITYSIDPDNLYEVIAQDPAANDAVAIGTTVDITVAVTGAVGGGSHRGGRRH